MRSSTEASTAVAVGVLAPVERWALGRSSPWTEFEGSASLEALRAGGQRAGSRCSFVSAYVERHPEYRDVLADGG